MKLKFENEVQPQHDLIALANAASFQDTYLSEPLSTFAQGWKDSSDLDGELEFIAPAVTVGRRFEFRKFNEESDFLTESDDARALGTDFKRVKFTGSIENGKTENRGLTIWVDLDEVSGITDYRQRYTAHLLRRCTRNDLITAYTLLAAGASNTNKTWNTESDPDADLLDMVDVAGNSMGFNPNRIYMGSNAWAKRIKSYRAQDNAGAYGSSAMKPADVAGWLGIEELRVSNIRYATSATEKSKVAGAVAIAFQAQSNAMTEDPSNIKRFVSPCGDGSMKRVYVRQVSEKIEAITVERYVRTVVVSSLGLKKLTIS